MEKNCSECGSKFSCDNNLTCWCAGFPKISQEQIDEKDCLCRECLLVKYRKKIIDHNF